LIRFLLSSGDADYDLDEIGRYCRQQFPHAARHVFIQAANSLTDTLLPATSEDIIIITHYDDRYRFLSPEERSRDQQLVRTFRESGPILILYLNTAPPFLLPYPECTHLIPSLSTTEKISRFSLIVGKGHLVSADEAAICPIFIIDLCARILARHPEASFQGFHFLVNQQGQRLLDEMISCATPQQMEFFFRCFLTLRPGGGITGTTNSLPDLCEKSGIDTTTVSRLLDMAVAAEFIRPIENNRYTLASDTLLAYWQTLGEWAAKEEEAITQYLFFRKLALLYQERKGDLLSAAQLGEADKWQENLHFSKLWAEQYAPETELILNYVRFSKQHHVADQEARERRRKRLLKLTRSIAVFVGIAFIVSSAAAVFAAVERNNALQSKTLADQEKQNAETARDQANDAARKAQSARLAESKAKEMADQERLKALQARDEAEQEKNTALLARAEAEQERNAALRARTEAETAKTNAELQRQRAENAGAAEAAARQQATLNFNNAEKLRRQQVARNDALSSLQLYYEGKFAEGLQKAGAAYQAFTQHDGQPYDSDILKALITGDAALRQPIITAPHELKNIQSSPSGNTLVYQTIHGKLATPTASSLPIPLPDILSYCLINDQLLAAGSSDGQLCLFSLAALSPLALIKATTGGPILHLSYHQDLIAISPGQIHRFDLSLKALQVINNPNIKPRSRFPQLPHQEYLLSFDKNTLNIITLASDAEPYPALTFSNPLTSSTDILAKDLIFVGDNQGFLHLANLRTGTILRSTKIHQSAITHCQLIHILNTPLLITAGFDHIIQIFPLEGPELQLLNPIDLRGHRSWIRTALWDPQRQILTSAGNDKQIRTWSLNPIHIIENIK
jgi:hypothetical protein